MCGYIVKRLLQMIIVLFVVSVAVFSLILLIPGDVATAMLGLEANDEDIQILREKLGLDEPFYIQYLRWLGNILRGDLGRSIATKHPVTLLFAQRLPVTLRLTLMGMSLAVLVGIPAGIIAAKLHNSFADMLIRGFATLGMSMPNFFLGLILILFFGVFLRWLPTSGVPIVNAGFGSWVRALILPAVTIGARFTAVVVRQTRAALLEVLGTDYIRTARAKGVSEFGVTSSHALRNALIPVITVIGLQTGRLFGGAVITETIFALPGMGSLLAQAVYGRDFVVVQAGVMFAVLAVLSVNLVVDILYAFLNPRIRYS